MTLSVNHVGYVGKYFKYRRDMNMNSDVPTKASKQRDCSNYYVEQGRRLSTKENFHHEVRKLSLTQKQELKFRQRMLSQSQYVALLPFEAIFDVVNK